MDSSKKNAIIFPEYVPPEGLSLLEIAVLLDNKLDYSDLGFQLYDLLLKGVLSFDGKMVTLADGKEKTPDLAAIERDLLNILFEDMQIREINLADINSVSSNKLYAIRVLVYSSLAQKGYYSQSPLEQREMIFSKVRKLLMLCSIYIQFSVFFLISAVWNVMKKGFYGPAWFTYAMLFALIILVPVAWAFMAYFKAISADKHVQKTPAGESVHKRAFGFREFIVTAEKDRIDYLISKEPDTYYRALSYAYLFGVIRKWLPENKNTQHLLYYQQFEDLDMYERGFEDSFTRANSVKWILYNIWSNLLPVVFFRLNRKKK